MVLTDFTMGSNEDAILQISLTPPANIQNWNIAFVAMNNFGGVSGLIEKNMASGYVGVSGISIVNQNAGVFNVQINSQDTSGLDTKNFAYSIQRLDSGARTILSEGYLSLSPIT